MSRQDGKAIATKGGTEVMSYSSGDYFGELVSCRTSRDLGYGLPNRVFFFKKNVCSSMHPYG